LGDRLFQVFPRASLTLQNLTLTGGHPPDNGHLSYIFPQVGVGGAIYNAGTLVLDHCIVTGNASADYNLYNPIPCGEDGGGIYNTGRLQMVQCLISDNSAGNGWTAYVQDGYYWGWHGVPGGNGGGVYNWFNGVCEFDFCVFSGNKSGDSRGLYPNNANNDNIGGSGGSGGGVCNLGKMTLTGCTISNNMTGFGQSVNNTNASGEAFPNYIGAIGGNGGVGAGIYNSGQLGLKFCSVSSNICGDGGEGGNGGNGTNNGFDVPGGYIVGDVFCRGGIGGEGAGLYNAGSASLDTCTFSGNRTGNGGNGGIGYTLGGDGGYGGRGAAIYNYGPFEIYTSLSFNILPPILVDFVPMTTVLSLSSCTIAGNICGHGGINGIGMSGNGQAGQPGLNGVGGAGGGILNDDTNTAVVVRNTLIASNQTDVYDATTENGLTANGQIANNDVLGPAVAGDFTSQGFNLIGVADDSTGFVNGTNADQVGSAVAPIDPLLGPLQLNGGPTPTLALLPGSPAIDQGKCFGVRIDQRGWARPYKNPRIPDAPGGDGSDIGAYERQSLRNP